MKMARRVGQDANRPFPWVVNDFGLVDAIESGLVNIPQLAVRDTSGSPIPGYFNIWRWILPRLTPAERGGRRGRVKPEAVLKYAHVPVAMLGGLWEVLRREWSEREGKPRPPVFIIVCNDTALAKIVYRWLAEDEAPVGIPPAHLDGLRNSGDAIRTIRVGSKVVRESDDGGAKSDADRWMRLTLDTVGKTDWPWDTQRRPIYPDGFEALAKKLERPLYPPGRDVRCIVSVGMLTEGWDCNTVTHIVGLRPFMSQLLCEQVVGRGLRRSSYAVGDNGKLGEEVAKSFGVPFKVVPLKENPAGNESRPPPKIWPIHALPERAELEVRFPRVERYMQRIRHRLKVDWDNIAPLCLDPMDIPPEVEMKAGLPSNTGRPALVGPGRLERVDLNPYCEGRRLQKLVFEMARDLTRDYRQQPHCDAPAHVLFPQIGAIVGRYLKEKVHALRPCRLRRRVARVLDPAARGARRPACPRRLAGGVKNRDGVLPVGAAPRLTSFLPYSHRCRLQTAPSRPLNVRARTDHVSDNNPVTDHTNTPPSTLIGPLFHLSVERDEDGRFVVAFPDCGWGATDGATRDEAVAEAKDLLRELIATTIREGKDLPEPSRAGRGRPLVVPPVQIALKAALYEAWREAGISQRRLARDLDVGESEVRGLERMLNPEHSTKAAAIDRALRRLGKRVTVTIDEAA